MVLRDALKILLLIGAVWLPVAGQQLGPPPHAPAPGSAALYVDHQQIASALAASIAAKADPALGPISSTDQYFINEVHRAAGAAPAVHPGWTELHYILQGSGTFVTGGTIRETSPGGPKVIEGGVSRKVQQGDAIIVPAGTPHWYQSIEGSLRAIEVRFIAPP
jgi:mannose-6-phosphate isomerase-like protein (cupin superfamily)